LKKGVVNEQCLVSKFWGKKSCWALAEPQFLLLQFNFFAYLQQNFCLFVTFEKFTVEAQHPFGFLNGNG